MPEIGTSGLMSGEGRRAATRTPRLSSTLPLVSSGGWIAVAPSASPVVAGELPETTAAAQTCSGRYSSARLA